ncbi:TM2 domain containing protein [Fibrisoma limi BUZ 3]|uniref:TM2 domain containing protein n=1 Tax=Fibrisoma limi BUZ 3 TaxID=1185876 RepID=I2GTN1_9BACT|nr:TM2 domain-containing protein [Fibrisoma limi]CCH57261.1 TM2 domain containing protein [Fibrisoma limi BUZ 3]
MKKIFLALMLTVGSLSVYANSATIDEYTIDDQQVEQLMAQSTDVSYTVVETTLAQSQQMAAKMTGTARVQADKEFVPALLLNLFLGGLGIHRLYLGTETLTWVGYILTCGGIFGIVPLVDLIVLIINNDNISKFVDNPKFFMWANN